MNSEDLPTGPTFTCEGCGGVFVRSWSNEEAAAETVEVFGAEALDDVAIVCEACWQAMRSDMPDLDELYRIAGF